VKLLDVARYSTQNLLRHKLRTGLTVSGVAVGMATLTLLVSLGEGIKDLVIGEFQTAEAATRIVVAESGVRNRLMRGFGQEEEKKPITDDVIAEFAAMDGVLAAYPGIQVAATAEIDSRDCFPVGIEGIPPEAINEAYTDGLLAGKYWSEHDAGRVCVFPSSLMRDMGIEEPSRLLGHTLQMTSLANFNRYRVEGEGPERRIIRPEGVEAIPVEVIGVYDSDAFGFQGARVHAPLGATRELAQELDDFGLSTTEPPYEAAYVRVRDVRQVEPIRKRIEAQEFDTITLSDQLTAIRWFFLGFEVVLGFFGGIGLLVAFFGIANTMVMAVMERTREIGVLKALGARNREIRRMVVSEAAAIGVLGGLIGIGIGWGIGLVLEAIGNSMFSADLEGRTFDGVFLVPWELTVLALLLATATATLAGIYPAWRAARLDPVVSLRVE